MKQSNETILLGNLTADPELRYTQAGVPVVTFRIACTDRIFDAKTNAWKDGNTVFMSVVVWRDQAENIAESLTKGVQVLVSGRLSQRSYENKDGQTVHVVELEADVVAVSLQRQTAKITKVNRSGGAQSAAVAQSAAAQAAPAQAAPAQAAPAQAAPAQAASAQPVPAGAPVGGAFFENPF